MALKDLHLLTMTNKASSNKFIINFVYCIVSFVDSPPFLSVYNKYYNLYTKHIVFKRTMKNLFRIDFNNPSELTSILIANIKYMEINSSL